jgi:hypothetical protein
MYSKRRQAIQDFMSMTPEQQNMLMAGGLIGTAGVAGSVGASALAGTIDNFAGEDTAFNSGEFLANGALVGAVPIGAGLGAAIGGTTYRLPANEATIDIPANPAGGQRPINGMQPNLPVVPNRFMRKGIGATVGGMATAIGVNHYMTEDMRREELQPSADPMTQPQSITSNIPMQQLQEISDLLGANGAF